MRDIYLVGFFFITVYYAYKRPYIGTAAWIWIALMAPAKWAFGFSNSLRMNLAIVVVTAMSYVFVQKDKKFQINGLIVWVLIFTFWTLVSTISNENLFPASVWSYWYQFIKVILLFIFITLTLKKRLHVDTFIWAIVLSISSYAAMESVKFVVSGGSHRIVGVSGIIEDRNDLAVAINMCIPLIIYLINTTEHALLKKGLKILAWMNVLAIIGTYSRGGFIGLIILAAAFWWTSNRKLMFTVIALLMIPVFLVNAPDEWKERQNTVSTASTKDGSFIGRIWAWKVSTLIANDYPLTGGGFNAVRDRALWRYYAPFTPDFGMVETPPIPREISPKAAHNIYMQVLSDHGYVGLMIFLFILLGTLRLNKKNLRLAMKHDQQWCVHLSKAFRLTLVGYCVTGANVSLAYFELFYAIVAVVSVISINQMYQDKTLVEKDNKLK